MTLRHFLLTAVLALSANLGAATPAPAAVEAVQAPAFLVRENMTQPLYPGLEVRNGDRISTGEGARAYLRLAEGSTVKLGESATINFYSTGTRSNQFFRGALDVLTGAFRFTTGAVAKLNRRDVKIRVGTATVGIRGTDVWGRSSAEKDLVCLIEGHVQIRHPGLNEPVDMAEANTFFVADKGATPQPVGPVDLNDLRKWSRETEIEAGDGAVRRGGRFGLAIGAATGSEAEALETYDAARLAGYPARIKVRGSQFQVVLSGFASREDAARAAEPLARKLGRDVSPLR